jgi:transposase-like protein
MWPETSWTEYNGPKNLDTKTGGLKTQMSVRKKYPADFKTKIVLEILKEEKSLSQISSEYGIHTTQLNRWKKQALEGLPQLFTDERKSLDAIRTGYEKQIQDLYAEVGRLTTQLNWLKKKSGL